MKNIFFDLDGTLAEWRGSSNPEELLRKGYFETLRPDDILTGFAESLVGTGGLNVYILSAYISSSLYALKEKQAWCDRYVPSIDREHRIFVPCGIDKHVAVEDITRKKIGKDDFLVDDYSHNLIAWQNAGGTAIKWLNGSNGLNQTFCGPRIMWTAELREAIQM